MSDFLMPSLGADMEAGTLVEWKVAPGDRVHRGDIVAVVETQKGAIEIEIFEDGVVEEICVPVGREVPVGAVLARLDGKARAAPSPPPKAEAPPAEAAPVPRPAAPARAPSPPAAGGQVRATPAARRRAAALGVDIGRLVGTGTQGAVTLADVERGIAQAPAAPRKAGFEPAAMRQAIAAAMSRSNRDIPHYFLSQTIDMGPALAWLEAANARRPVADRLLPAVLLLKAVARGLVEVPELNGFWGDGGFRAGPGVHVGWAIALRGGGLVAPAVHDADRASLDELMRRLRDLVQRARAGGLRSSELSDATITVTSLGERGAESVMGVIYPPQVALLGFGRIAARPWVVDGAVVARPLVTASLAADHRASDGHRGGRLLAAIERHLQQPQQL
jgi:pyruvate dehydrogenase E2 component (dihydrolipoamide acetyltransferase)